MGILALPKHVNDNGLVRKCRFWDHIHFITHVILGDQPTMAKINYTEDMTAIAVTDYQAGVPIEDIALTLDKSVRSVRSKLVREGVYIAQEKPMSSKKDNTPSKKELLLELKRVAPFEVDGFEGATKTAITTLLNQFVEKSDHGT